jgi:hypothetical protein
MYQILFRVAFSLLPLIAGVVLPYIGPQLSWDWHFANLFWGAVYGLGLFMASLVAPIYSHVTPLDEWTRNAVLFGVLGWPILVTAVLYITSGVLWRYGTKRQKRFAVALLVLSLLVVVPLRSACPESLAWLPDYWCIMFVIY